MSNPNKLTRRARFTVETVTGSRLRDGRPERTGNVLSAHRTLDGALDALAAYRAGCPAGRFAHIFDRLGDVLVY